jgi:Helix-turn-helix domain
MLSTQNEPASSQARILDDYFDTNEAAAELGVSPLTLVRWRLAKQGPPVTQIGRRLYYKKTSTRAWVAAQERPASGRKSATA